ncbi:MAG: hypothetical protein WC197_06610 [Candidatus Gastranaerophilaceae bacterium]
MDNEKQEKDNLFTGEKASLDKGKIINMTVSNVISSGYNTKGDEFFAEVTNDVETTGGILIPAGSIAHGKISTIEDSKNLGRDGYVNLDFDYIATPDGREIPIQANMTTKKSIAASTAKIVATDAAYTVGGSLVGGYAALKFFGLGTAVASHGYTVAGGAGVGALIGTGIALTRKGDGVLLSPGDEIKVKVLGKLELPVMSEDAFKQEEVHLDGLDVTICNYVLEKDPFGEANTITLSLAIVNKTNKTFSSFDMALINDYKAVYYASPFGDTELWFTKIPPNARIAGKISFSVDNPKRKHWLVFYDSRTRKPVAKISVDNAIKEIKKRNKNKKG